MIRAKLHARKLRRGSLSCKLGQHFNDCVGVGVKEERYGVTILGCTPIDDPMRSRAKLIVSPSSDSVPNAKARALYRVVSALEAEGIRFTDGGVHLQRAAPTSTVLHSEGARA